MASDTQTAQAPRIYGDWVRPVNRWQGAENSIHTDVVAQKIGMRGGTIPGTVHLMTRWMKISSPLWAA